MIIEDSRFVALLDGAQRCVTSILETSHAVAAARDAAGDFTALPRREQSRCWLVMTVVAVVTYITVSATLPARSTAIVPLAGAILGALGCACGALPFRK
jgi:hypothetical protein